MGHSIVKAARRQRHVGGGDTTSLWRPSSQLHRLSFVINSLVWGRGGARSFDRETLEADGPASDSESQEMVAGASAHEARPADAVNID